MIGWPGAAQDRLHADCPSRTTGERLRIAALFMVFEGGMPLIGLGLGATLACRACALIGLGAWMQLSGDSDAEEGKASRL